MKILERRRLNPFRIEAKQVIKAQKQAEREPKPVLTTKTIDDIDTNPDTETKNTIKSEPNQKI